MNLALSKGIIIKRWMLMFVLLFSMIFAVFPQSKADAATTSLPWNFSYAFDTNLDGATRFYYDSSKGNLKITMTSSSWYTSGDFKVTLMKDSVVDYAVSHAGFPRNGTRTVIFSKQYNGNKLPSGYYWLKFENPHPCPYITGKGTATYTR